MVVSVATSWAVAVGVRSPSMLKGDVVGVHVPEEGGAAALE